MKKLFIYIFLFLVGCFLLVASADAHVGGGPPFLKVDGIFTPTNVLYFGVSKISVPQDLAPKNYIVNQPISFFIDTTQLLLPPDIATATTFRWTFDSTTKHYEYGTTITHTYTKPQSYLLVLEAKAPGQQDFVTIDTIQINVLPNESYKMPHANFSIFTNKLQANDPIALESTISVDPSTKMKSVAWDFGDQTLIQNISAQHIYQDIHDYATYPIVFQITDANGFIFDTGFIAQAIHNKWQFIDKNGRSDTLQAAQKLPENGWVIRGIAALISLCILGFLLRRSRIMRAEKKID